MNNATIAKLEPSLQNLAREDYRAELAIRQRLSQNKLTYDLPIHSRVLDNASEILSMCPNIERPATRRAISNKQVLRLRKIQLFG